MHEAKNDRFEGETGFSEITIHKYNTILAVIEQPGRISTSI